MEDVKVSNGTTKLFVIESGVPVPRLGQPYRNGKTPMLRQLKPKQCVLLPGTVKTNSSIADNVFGAGNYTARTEGENTRIWRLK
jgi:hypothetical protein